MHEEDEDGPLEEPEASVVVACPYCGEAIDFVVDPWGGAHQEYVEDCEVCCRPWSVTVTVDRDGFASVTARTLDDA